MDILIPGAPTGIEYPEPTPEEWEGIVDKTLHGSGTRYFGPNVIGTSWEDWTASTFVSASAGGNKGSATGRNLSYKYEDDPDYANEDTTGEKYELYWGPSQEREYSCYQSIVVEGINTACEYRSSSANSFSASIEGSGAHLWVPEEINDEWAALVAEDLTDLQDRYDNLLRRAEIIESLVGLDNGVAGILGGEYSPPAGTVPWTSLVGGPLSLKIWENLLPASSGSDSSYYGTLIHTSKLNLWLDFGSSTISSLDVTLRGSLEVYGEADHVTLYTAPLLTSKTASPVDLFNNIWVQGGNSPGIGPTEQVVPSEKIGGGGSVAYLSKHIGGFGHGAQEDADPVDETLTYKMRPVSITLTEARRVPAGTPLIFDFVSSDNPGAVWQTPEVVEIP